MKSQLAAGVLAWAVAIAVGNLTAQEPTPTPPTEEENMCLACHGNGEVMEGDLAWLHVTADDLADDIHWKKGIRCSDCHGGDSSSTDFREAHAEEAGYRTIESPADMPSFCGHCHSNMEYMRRFQPSPRIDQESEYWTSGHGQRLKEDKDDKVATCVSCHSHHGIRAVDDLQSPVFPTNVAKTCGACHADKQLMAERQYNGRPLGHDQLELWSASVHAEALLKNNDLSAPTCNDCHGNHGALPPNVDSVSNACGTCHVKNAELFAKTLMQHRFQQANLPGCATCHGNHEIYSPTDDMLGLQSGSVCVECHEEGKFGATLAGADVAKAMRIGLDQLNERIGSVEEKLTAAERLGMEVQAPRFELRKATDALVNARTLVHGFAIDPMQKTLNEGLAVTQEVEQKADAALREHTQRRVWLAVFLVPILLVVGLLLVVIRTLAPAPTDAAE